jgi:hypothetical protein
MSSEAELDEIRAELNRLSGDKDYKQFRDTIEKLSILANAQYQGQAVASADEIRNLLDDVNRMQQRIREGTNPRELYQEVLSGDSKAKTNESDLAKGERMVALGDAYHAGGDVIQPGRDSYKADQITIITSELLRGSIDEAKRGLDRILVPVVLLVMTVVESLEIDAEELFQSLNASSGLQDLGLAGPLVTREKVDTILQSYAATPEDWRPFSDSPDTLKQLVTQKLAAISNFKKPLVPDFIDVRQLANDTSEQGFRKNSLKLLRQEGCIVIMDIISMHHKVIQRAFRRSLLDVYPNIPVIRMSPISSIQFFDDQQMLNFDDKYREMEIYKRLNWDEDDSCRDVTNSGALGRWINGRVPEMLRRRDSYKLAQQNVQSTYKDPD